MSQRAKTFTRHNLLMTISFYAVFAFLFWGAERLFFSESLYCTTWTRIRDTATVPDVLIVGNSHAFCSFVPDILNGSLDIDSAVLSASGQDAYGVTDAFETSLQTGKPSLVILEINAFNFESGIMAKEHKSSALDNINGMPGLARRTQVAARELGVDNVPQGVFQLLRADLMWSRWTELFSPKDPNRYAAQDVLGYKYLNWFAGGDYDSRNAIVEKNTSSAAPMNLLDLEAQTELRRFFSMAQANGVEVWVVKTPTAISGVSHPSQIDEAAEIAKDYGKTVTFCHDFCDNLPALQFTSADFYDRGHLNRRGAAKFTNWFAEILGEKLGLIPNFQRAFAYADEQIIFSHNAMYQYTMKATGEDILYRFELEEEGGNRLIQDWSEVNTTLALLPPDQAERMVVSMCPAARFEACETEGLTLAFMMQNRYVINAQ